jgi:hypothetical protein
MSTTGKVVLGIVVLVIVLGGGYYYYAHSKMATVGMNATSTSMDGMAMDGMASASAATAGMQATAAANTSLPGGSSDSDAALDQDASSIDTQMSGLNSDNANESQSLNNQSASQ